MLAVGREIVGDRRLQGCPQGPALARRQDAQPGMQFAGDAAMGAAVVAVAGAGVPLRAASAAGRAAGWRRRCRCGNAVPLGASRLAVRRAMVMPGPLPPSADAGRSAASSLRRPKARAVGPLAMERRRGSPAAPADPPDRPTRPRARPAARCSGSASITVRPSIIEEAMTIRWQMKLGATVPYCDRATAASEVMRARGCGAVDDEDRRLARPLGEVERRADRPQIVRAGPGRDHDQIALLHDPQDRHADGRRRVDEHVAIALLAQPLQVAAEGRERGLAGRPAAGSRASSTMRPASLAGRSRSAPPGRGPAARPAPRDGR